MVLLWPLTKKNVGLFVLEERSTVHSMYDVTSTSLGPPLKLFHYDFGCFNVGSNSIGFDNFKRVIKYQTLIILFYVTLNQ